MSDPRKTDAALNRRAFERWLVESGFVLDYPITKLGLHPMDARYLDRTINLMWRAWRAGQIFPDPGWHAARLVEPHRLVICANCGAEPAPEFDHVAVPLPEGAVAVTAFIRREESEIPF